MNTGMKLLFDSLSDGILILSPEGQAKYGNPVAHRMLGRFLEKLSQQQAVSKKIRDLQAGYIKLPVRFEIEALAGEPIEAELMNSPVGADLVLLLHDVAGQRFYQSTVDNLLTLVYESCRDSAEACLTDLEQAICQRSDSALTNARLTWGALQLKLKQLNDLACLHAGESMGAVERVLLPDLINAALANIVKQAGKKNITFALSGVDAELPPVYGSQPWLLEVMTSLLEDMIARSLEGSEILLKARQYGAFGTVALSSNGRALAPHMRDRVFLPFHGMQQGHARPEGLGLGLALAKAIAERHGGHLRIDEDVPAITLELPTGAPKKEAEVNAAQIERYAHDLSQLMARRLSTG